MDENIFDKIHEVDLKKTMEQSYIEYSMSVIADRALPDVRDGLKPVQRRILYAMVELGNTPDKPYRKCARIVGDTMGKYHPHGDSSIYGALVNMAQDWSMRYTLVDGHGNFGSVDGDGAAAMRYTEARLTKLSLEMIADIRKDTVKFSPNFDETEKEPTVLPARFPNLLVNGTTGIAVGMATNMPPHNLREVIAAVCKIIDNKVLEDRKTDIEEVMEIVKGPDFPTGATIVGKRGIEEAYRTGRGKVKVRAVTDIEPMEGGKHRIVVTEIPFLVNKARMIEKIAELVKDKKLDGITGLRDETNREGMRIVIELRKDVNPSIMLNLLLKHTQLQDSFGIINLALVNNQPKVLNLLQLLELYLDHQKDVVTRRTKYDLDNAEKRAHIIEGLFIALDNIDRVITIIRGSENVATAKKNLMDEFGLSEAQAQAIVDMRLRALTGLERDKLQKEYDELMAQINYFKELLADEKKLLGVIRDEINVISDKYGDDRKTQIVMDEEEFDAEDLIPMENTVVAMTNLGYIKRMSVDNFKAQNRGGRGIKGMQTIDDDYIANFMMTCTHHYIFFFTTKGRVYRMKAYQIPEASRTSRGVAIVNLLQLEPDEKISAMIPIPKYEEDVDLIMATRKGIVKKTSLNDFKNIRKMGIIAINLQDDDELIGVKHIKEDMDVLLITKKGQCMRFGESDVRETGRSSMGVRGVRLSEDDEVIGMQTSAQGEYMLIITEKGMGKKTAISEFPKHFRGGKGVRCYNITEKTGDIVAIKAVVEDMEVMLITDTGIVIRTRVNEISTTGRVASGVRLMRMTADEEATSKVVGVVRIWDDPNSDEDPNEDSDEEYVDEEGSENEQAEETTEADSDNE
ncbi:MAG: DNA gyrase subunit A [Lachnospiraceae bacterium]|nr:DNA gyrase subunit A [Lachnospiraceae bacterium]